MNTIFKYVVYIIMIRSIINHPAQNHPIIKHRLKKQQNNQQIDNDQAQQSIDYLNQNQFYSQNYEFNKVNGQIKTVQQDYHDKMEQSQLDYKQYLENYRKFTQQQYQDSYNHMIGHN